MATYKGIITVAPHMSIITSQITSNLTDFSTICSGQQRIKHPSFALLVLSEVDLSVHYP